MPVPTTKPTPKPSSSIPIKQEGGKAPTTTKAPTTKSKAAPATKATPKTRPKAGIEDKLYEQCLAHHEAGHLWSLKELSKIIGLDEDQTLILCNILIKNFLFQPTTVENVAQSTTSSAFRIRARDAAEKYLTITEHDAREVYRHIEDAGATGAWKTSLKRKTKLAEARVEKILRGLITSKHIKQLRNARANAKKTFLLYDIVPGKNLIGGAWHDGGELDEAMIDVAADIVTLWIKEQSWVLGPRMSVPEKKSSKKRKAVTEDDQHVTAGSGSKRQKLDKANGVPASTPKTHPQPVSKETGTEKSHLDEMAAYLDRSKATHMGRLLLPHRPDYAHYPTVGAMTDTLNASGIIPGVSVSTADMRDLFRVLVASGRIERIGARPKHNYASEDNSEIDGIVKREHTEEVAEEQAERLKELESEAASEGVEPGYEGLYRWIRRPDWEVALDDRKVIKVEDGEGVQTDPREGIGEGDGVGNGLSEVPCSKCPVANICSEKGPVSPAACEYFDEWTSSKLSEEWY